MVIAVTDTRIQTCASPPIHQHTHANLRTLLPPKKWRRAFLVRLCEPMAKRLVPLSMREALGSIASVSICLPTKLWRRNGKQELGPGIREGKAQLCCIPALVRLGGSMAKLQLQHKRRGNLNFSGMFWFQLIMVSWHGKPPGIQWQVHDTLVTVWPNRPRPGVVAHPWSRSSGKPLSNKMTFRSVFEMPAKRPPNRPANRKAISTFTGRVGRLSTTTPSP